MNLNSIHQQNEEEYWNILTHGIGIPISVGVMTYMLIVLNPGIDVKLLATKTKMCHIEWLNLSFFHR